MSVINQMLKDLEQRQQGGEGAVYVPPVRQQGWWMLVLTLICGLALGILGWRTWIYWQQSLAQASEPGADAVARAVPATPAYVEQEPVDLVVALPTPGPGPETRSRPAVNPGWRKSRMKSPMKRLRRAMKSCNLSSTPSWKRNKRRSPRRRANRGC